MKNLFMATIVFVLCSTAFAAEDNEPFFLDAAPAASQEAATPDAAPVVSDDVTPHPDVHGNGKAKKKKEKKLHELHVRVATTPIEHPLNIGVRMNVAPSSPHTTTPIAAPGFAVATTESRVPQIFAAYRFTHDWAAEITLAAFQESSTENLTFMGADLGSITVTTPKYGVGVKYYHFARPGIDPYIGLSVEYTEISGAYSMGGVPFDTSGDGWKPVLKLGVEIPLRDKYSVQIEYAVRGSSVETEIPTAGTVETSRGDELMLGILARW